MLTNAVTFTKTGTIIVNAKVKENTGDGQIIVSVRDTGSGIVPEIMPRLFTIFASKSDSGAGLGLYLKIIIEAHGGRIWAENNSDGRGATFSFTLPVNKAE